VSFIRSLGWIAVAVLVVAGLSGCASASVRKAATPLRCPADSLAGWQRLANRVAAPVYCPTWLPNPLSPSLAGSSHAGTYVAHDRNYLVSYIETDVIGSNNSEVHVNLRGYPGRQTIPICENTLSTGGKSIRPKVPCFSDAYAHKSLAGKRITVYTANQGADTWHVAYVWHHDGSLYVASQHVTPPYSFRAVLANLDRLARTLVLVAPGHASST
jgi:hypothetical protein